MEAKSRANSQDAQNLTSNAKPLAAFEELQEGVKFPMWFGLATAAAHVERSYPNDPWVAWAQRGHVAAYRSSVAGPNPDQRLRFLEEPMRELELAAKTGVKVFRMGVEWGRLMPDHPDLIVNISKTPGISLRPDINNLAIHDYAAPKNYDGTHKKVIQDQEALQRYRQIIIMAKELGMKVMLTLFHHSMPLWSSAFGGWLEDVTVQHFMSFARELAVELHDVVDYWVTFNEPHIYVLLSNCAGLWPPGPVQPFSQQAGCLSGALPFVAKDSGGYTRAMGNIEKAHKLFYNWAHGPDSPLKDPRIGVAHNVAFNEAWGTIDMASVAVMEEVFKFAFIDALKGHMDWLGLNYYSKEVISGGGPMVVDEQEYSESGRLVSPDGLYAVLMQFHKRYPQEDPSVKFKSIIMTENGISDASDILRPAYIVEHLLAIREARRQGVPLEGYIHWTVSDNWEWADGYCPMFGLVHVDRSTENLTRTPRKSYEFFTDIVKSRQITHEQRVDSWELVRKAALLNKERPFCRHEDGKTGLDEPEPRKIRHIDWLFSKLTAEEDGGCHFTPWIPEYRTDAREMSAHISSGSCDVHVFHNETAESKKRLPSSCRRAIRLKRETRCPGLAPIIEKKSTVCEATKLEWQQVCKDFKGSKCCCDASGSCGFSTLKNRWLRWKCPQGLEESDNKKCRGQESSRTLDLYEDGKPVFQNSGFDTALREDGKK